MAGSNTVRRVGGLVAGLVMAAILTGCLDTSTTTAPSPDAAWEATLESTYKDGLTGPSVTGHAAVLLKETRTEVGIGLDQLSEALTLSWGLFNGTCVDPGARIGDAEQFPLLSQSKLSSSVALGLRISEGGTYHVAVTDTASDQLLSCGDLESVDL